MLKKQLLRNIILGVVVGLLGGFSLLHPVQAASQNENADFEIQPIMPEGQVDESLNYFDVQFAPAQRM